MISAPASVSKKVTVGHPVDVSSGVVFTAWHDFEFRGHVPMIWRRFYSTGNTALTPLGRGWMSSFFMSIQEKGENLLVQGDEGHTLSLRRPGPNETSSEFYHQMEARSQAGGYLIRDWHRHQRLHFNWCEPRSAFLLSRVEDLSGNALVLNYDQAGRLDLIEQSSLNRTFRFGYTERSLIRQIELLVPGFPAELLVTYQYNDQDQLIQATDATGHAIHYGYNSSHYLICERNKLGGSFYFEYDKAGRCIRTWGDGGYLERQLAYDVERHITRVTNSRGATTAYFFASNGDLQRKVDSFGNVALSKSIPGLAQKVSAVGSVTLKEYNERSNLVKLTNGRGDAFNYDYNRFDQVSCVTDPAGHRWPKQYDEQGRLSAFSDPLGNTWQLLRSHRGEIIKEVDPEGREVDRRYEHGLRWREISDSIGYLRCEYNPKGRPVILTDRRGVVEMFETDAAGRTTRNSLSDNADVRYEYDAAGNVTKVRYLNGATWRFQFDTFSRVVAIVKPCGGTIRATYDNEGHRLSLINERGEEMLDTYDVEGRLVVRKYFDGRFEKFDHDALGHITSVERSDGSSVFWKYDPVGNLVEETAKGPLPPEGRENQRDVYTAIFEWDWLGRLVKAVNDAATVEFVYDPAGRLIEERQNEISLRYAYDKSGKLIERELRGGSLGKISLSYNEAGLLNSILDKRGVVQTLEYDNTGCVSRRTARGGIVEQFTYDERRRVADQRVTQNGALLLKRSYRYDAADNLVSLQDSLRGQFEWEYDAELRLIHAQGGSRSERFSYEIGGNLLQSDDSVYAYQPGSRLTGIADIQFAYDDCGNVVSRVRGDQATRYLYDLKGRLTKVYLPDQTTVEFAYDALGRRVSKRSSAGEVKFVWSNQVLAAVKSPDGTWTEVLQSSATRRPSVQWVGEKAEHFICNHLGTPQEVVEAGRGIVWSATYSAFGKVVETPGVSAQAYCLRFPGQFEDRETGLFYNFQRYYDPSQGRFLTPDPIGIDGGLNLYDYPRDPINWFDPLGLSCPNPQLIDADPQGRWEVYQHDDGQLTIRADCTRAYANRPPSSSPVLRATIHAGEDNEINLPEACLGEGGRVIVMEGTHRSAAASRGAQMPQDPNNPHLGGVPGRPGWMEYEYTPRYNDPTKIGTPLQDLQYPPGYPHQLPP